MKNAAFITDDDVSHRVNVLLHYTFSVSRFILISVTEKKEIAVIETVINFLNHFTMN
jgi:hypothetical protein